MNDLSGRSMTVSSGTQYISANQSVSDITVNSNGYLYVNGGHVERVTVNYWGFMYISDGYAAQTTLNGYMYVESQGSATNTYINSGGSQTVYDGTVTSTTIQNGGRQVLGNWSYASERGSAVSTVLNGSAQQEINSNGYARNTTINSGAMQNVNGAANITTINNGGKQGAYGVVDNTVINSGGYQYVTGSAYRTTVKAGGWQYVASSTVSDSPGYAENVTVEAGGSQTVMGNLKNVTVYGIQDVSKNRNGVFTDVRIMKGGQQTVESSVISGTTVYGSQTVTWGGSAWNTTIKSGGIQDITSDGAAYSASVEAGGSQLVLGVAQWTSLSGVQHVSTYHPYGFPGSSYNAKVWKTGSQIIDYGYDYNAIVNGSQVINCNGKSYNAAINNGGFQIVSSGGSAYNTGLSGIQQVYSGAIVSSAKIYVKGEQRVYSGANVAGVIATGRQTVYAGGHVSGGVFNKGAIQNVHGQASGALIAGTQNIYSGGRASAVKVTGLQTVAAGGHSVDANVVAGGSMNVAGIASNASVAGTQTILKGGSAAGLTRIWSAGSQIVQDGGKETGTIVNGVQIISKGGQSLNAAINNGATQRIYGSADNTGLSGTQYVYSGAAVTQARIYVKGVQHLLSGASVSGAKATGRQIVSSGAAAAHGVFNNGARQDVYGTVTNITMAGVQNVYLGGTVNGGKVTATGWLNIDAGKLNLTANMSVAGQLTLANATVSGTTDRQIVLSSTSLFTLGANNNVNTGLSISGRFIANNRNSKLASLTTASTANTTFDLRNLSASASPLMTLTTKSALNGYAIIQVKTGQGMGNYILGSNLSRTGSVALSVNGANVGTMAVGGSRSYNGVKYTLTNTGNNLALTLAVDAGRIYTASNARSLDAMTGTEKSDIFLNSQGDDVISGNGGRDVAVYGTEKWGRDTVQATNGTMTLLFRDLKSSDVRQTMSGKDMILSKAGNSDDEIRVKDWNSATHNVVFGGTMGELSRYAAAANPSESLASAASNEVWRKSGLLA